MTHSRDKLPDGPAPGETARRTAQEDQVQSGTFASPPCFMHELEASYMGYFNYTEIMGLLNELLEGERAGARGVREMAAEADDPEARSALRAVARDEARFCAMLTNHIIRLGGEPSVKTGAFYDKLRAVETPDGRVAMLNRGQRWVARRLRETLPGIEDESLYRDLKEMLEVHEDNISRCDELISAP